MARMLFSDPLNGPAETVVATLRDYPEWHRGRTHYGVWIIPVVDPWLLAYIDEARAALGDLLHPVGHRQPHLTVFVCGFHGAGCRDDDFPEERLHVQRALLAREGGPPCLLPLLPADSFASAAFVPVDDRQGHLGRWRSLLRQAGAEIRSSAYVPHITLGLYRQQVSAAELRRRLAALPAPCMSLQVDELRYVTYQAREHQGRLSDVLRVVLSDGEKNGTVQGTVP